MLRHLLSVAVAALLASAGPAHALFHFAHIAELNANGGGSSGEQYVEIEMDLGGQTVTLARRYRVSGLPKALAAGDFVGDDIPDVLWLDTSLLLLENPVPSSP